LTITVTPGIGDPEASVTVPLADFVWEYAPELIAKRSKIVINLFII
jgi:hypothetical protein